MASGETICRFVETMTVIMSHIFMTKLSGLTDNKTVGLKSPDGSQNGTWYFPNSVVTRLVTQGRNCCTVNVYRDLWGSPATYL